ncbi:hypothetical protein F511_02681 [Dorcoceras hygrometricum]|uniref:Uncharacterized protein n=1 Tax=Dorcoceras hygrometricum TaxID=472368 RepID=A0A2Z7D6M8_9LAMI|nr:hypothetical protein F511_02681 [Dorcoceras hygrometricum]
MSTSSDQAAPSVALQRPAQRAAAPSVRPLSAASARHRVAQACNGRRRWAQQLAPPLAFIGRLSRDHARNARRCIGLHRRNHRAQSPVHLACVARPARDVRVAIARLARDGVARAIAPARRVAPPHMAAAGSNNKKFFCFQFQISRSRCNSGNDVLKDSSIGSDTTVGKRWRIRIPFPGAQRASLNLGRPYPHFDGPID